MVAQSRFSPWVVSTLYGVTVHVDAVWGWEGATGGRKWGLLGRFPPLPCRWGHLWWEAAWACVREPQTVLVLRGQVERSGCSGALGKVREVPGTGVAAATWVSPQISASLQGHPAGTLTCHLLPGGCEAPSLERVTTMDTPGTHRHTSWVPRSSALSEGKDVLELKIFLTKDWMDVDKGGRFSLSLLAPEQRTRISERRNLNRLELQRNGMGWLWGLQWDW